MKRNLFLIIGMCMLLVMFTACQPGNNVILPPPAVDDTPEGTPVAPSTSGEFNEIFSTGAEGTYYLASDMRNLGSQLNIKATDGKSLVVNGNRKTISRDVPQDSTSGVGTKSIVEISYTSNVTLTDLNVDGITPPDKWNSGEFGVKVYDADNVTLNNISVTKANAGILIGENSSATLSGTIDLSGNKYGGINVDESTLTIAAGTKIVCTDTTVPAIWIDSAGKGTVTDNSGSLVAYTITTEGDKNGQIWYLTAAQNNSFDWTEAGVDGTRVE